MLFAVHVICMVPVPEWGWGWGKRWDLVKFCEKSTYCDMLCYRGNGTLWQCML